MCDFIADQSSRFPGMVGQTATQGMAGRSLPGRRLSGLRFGCVVIVLFAVAIAAVAAAVGAVLPLSLLLELMNLIFNYRLPSLFSDQFTQHRALGRSPTC